jgi:hypothetical protein
LSLTLCAAEQALNLHPLRELARQGRDHGQLQLAKYDEALTYAPNSSELKVARKTAAKQETLVNAGLAGRPMAAGHG